MTPGEQDEVAPSFDDGALVGRADHGDAPAAAELEQALVAERAQGTKHGVRVDAEHGSEIPGRREALAGLGLAVGDRTANLGGGLLEQRRRASIVELARTLPGTDANLALTSLSTAHPSARTVLQAPPRIDQLFGEAFYPSGANGG